MWNIRKAINSESIQQRHRYRQSNKHLVAVVSYTITSNDGSNKLNKATFSSELVIKLLNIYGKQDSDFVVYDPFGGTGTTAVGAKKFGCSCICSELSEEQCKYAKERLK